MLREDTVLARTHSQGPSSSPDPKSQPLQNDAPGTELNPQRQTLAEQHY